MTFAQICNNTNANEIEHIKKSILATVDLLLRKLELSIPICGMILAYLAALIECKEGSNSSRNPLMRVEFLRFIDFEVTIHRIGLGWL